MRAFIMYLFVICALSILILGCDKKETAQQQEKAMFTEQEIIEIANKKAKSLDFQIDDSNFYNVYYDKDNKRWKENQAFLKEYLPNIADECNRKLTGREYHTVLYKPKSEEVMGGVLWVFVDPISGKVIYVLPEL